MVISLRFMMPKLRMVTICYIVILAAFFSSLKTLFIYLVKLTNKITFKAPILSRASIAKIT